MSKGNTIKEALGKFEEKQGEKACDSKEVKMCGNFPPIEKMDASLSTLTCCEKLSLSTNAIEKIANLNGLKHLKILSLGRNNIKSLTGLEAVAETLEELWISYNLIEKLKGINVLKKLKVLFMSNNSVKDVAEFNKLADLPCLGELVFVDKLSVQDETGEKIIITSPFEADEFGNPLVDNWAEPQGYFQHAKQTFPNLKKLDGEPIVRDEKE